MKVFTRTCIKPWSITAENGDHFDLVPGREYTTSQDRADGTCIVYSNYWVPVPHDCLSRPPEPEAAADYLTPAEREYRSWGYAA